MDGYREKEIQDLAKRIGIDLPKPTSVPKIAPTKNPTDLDVPSILDDEFSKLGYSQNARLALLSNVGRENGWNAQTIFNGHADPANQQFNRGIISWQKDRQTNLDKFVRSNGGDFTPSEKNLRLQARFLDNEMQSPEWKSINQRLKSGDLTLDEAYPLLQKYIKYQPRYESDNKKREKQLLENGFSPKQVENFFSDLAQRIGSTNQPQSNEAFTGFGDLENRIGVSPTTQPQPIPNNPNNAIQPTAPDDLYAKTPDEVKTSLLNYRQKVSDELTRAKTSARRNILLSRLKNIDNQINANERRRVAETNLQSNQVTQINLAPEDITQKQLTASKVSPKIRDKYGREVSSIGGEDIPVNQTKQEKQETYVKRDLSNLKQGETYFPFEKSGKFEDFDYLGMVGDKYRFRTKDGDEIEWDAKTEQSRNVSSAPNKVTLATGLTLTKAADQFNLTENQFRYTDDKGKSYISDGKSFQPEEQIDLPPLSDAEQKQQKELTNKAVRTKGTTETDSKILDDENPVYDFETSGQLKLKDGKVLKYDQNQEGVGSNEYRFLDDKNQSVIYNPKENLIAEENAYNREKEFRKAQPITQAVRISETDNPRDVAVNATISILGQAGYKVQAQDVENAYNKTGTIKYDGKDYTDIDWRKYVSEHQGQIPFQVTKELIEDILTEKNKRLDTALAQIEKGIVTDDGQAQTALSTRFDELPKNQLDAALAKGKEIEKSYQDASKVYENSEDAQIRNNAKIYAARDAGWLTANEADELANAQSELRQQIEAEERLNKFTPDNSAGLSVTTVPVQQMRRRTEEEIQAAVQKRLDAIIKENRTAKAYLDAQKEVNKEQNEAFAEYQKINGGGYIFPLIILRKAANAVPNAVADVMKTVDILGEALGINPYTLSFDSRPAYEREWSKAANSLKDYLKQEGLGENITRSNSTNKFDIVGKVFNDFPDVAGQTVFQFILGATTGGAVTPFLVGASQGISSQYDEAVSFGATKEQRLFAAFMGGAAAVPDLFLFNKWFKGSGAAERNGFLSKFAGSLYSKFIGSGIVREEAEELTKVSLKSFFGKVILGGGVPEAVQEYSEDKINDAVAYLTYDKSDARAKELFTPVSQKNLASLVGGFVGGTFGGGFESIAENYNYQNLEREINKVSFKGKEYDTPDQVKPTYLKMLQTAGQAADALKKAETYKTNTKLQTEAQQKEYARGLQIAQEYYAEAEQLKNEADTKAKEILGVKDLTLENAQNLLKINSAGFETLKPLNPEPLKNEVIRPVEKSEDLTNKTVIDANGIKGNVIEATNGKGVVVEWETDKTSVINRKKLQVVENPQNNEQQTKIEPEKTEPSANLVETDNLSSKANQADVKQVEKLSAPQTEKSEIEKPPENSQEKNETKPIVPEPSASLDKKPLVSDTTIKSENAKVENKSNIVEEKTSEKSLSESVKDIPQAEKPTEKPSPKPEKQPFEMTRDEFVSPTKEQIAQVKQQILESYGDYTNADKGRLDRIRLRPDEVHQSLVETALKQGKTVPPEVLKDYPDLAKKYEPKPTETIQAEKLNKEIPSEPEPKEAEITLKDDVSQKTKPATPKTKKGVSALMAERVELGGEVKTRLEHYNQMIADGVTPKQAEYAVLKAEPATPKEQIRSDEVKETAPEPQDVQQTQKLTPTEDTGSDEVNTESAQTTLKSTAPQTEKSEIEKPPENSAVEKTATQNKSALYKKGRAVAKELFASHSGLKSIVGENANLSLRVRQNLEIAKEMERAGKSSDEIFLATGWQRGKDNYFKYDLIDDVSINKTKLREMLNEGIPARLSEVLTSPLLFEAYPKLKNTVVTWSNLGKDIQASFNKNGNEITLNSRWKQLHNLALYFNRDGGLKTDLIHEVQHNIQEIEGFSSGENSESFEDINDYWTKAGEVEARNAGKRLDLSPEARRSTPISATEDVAREDQWLRENESSPLKKIVGAKTSETIKYQQQLAEMPFKSELLPLVESTVTGDEVKLSLEAGEIARIVNAIAGNENFESAPLLGGVFLDENDIAKYTDLLTAFGDEVEDRTALDKLKNDILKASEINGTAVLQVYDKAVPHERVHQLGYLLAVNKSLKDRHGKFNELVKLPSETEDFSIIEKAHESFFGNYGYSLKDKAVLVEETATYIVRGDYAKLGLSEAEAAKFLELWFDSYIERNGTRILDKIGEFADERSKTTDIIERVRQRQLERSGASLQTAESGRQGGDNGLREESTSETRSEEPESDKSQGLKKERQTVVSAEEAGAVEKNAIQGNARYYRTKSRDANIRTAQEAIERDGLEIASYNAKNPPEKISPEFTAYQMEVVNLLNSQAAEAIETGNSAFASAKLNSAQEIVAALAEKGTEMGQAISQLAAWQKTDPKAVTGYVQKRRQQNQFHETLTPQESKVLRDAAEELQKQNQKIAELQNQIDKLNKRLTPKPSKSVDAEIRKTLKTKADEALNKLRDKFNLPKDILKMVSGRKSSATVGQVSDNQPQPKSALKSVSLSEQKTSRLDEETLKDFSSVGANILLEGQKEKKPLSVDAFKREMLEFFGNDLRPHLTEIHALSVKELSNMKREAYRASRIETLQNIEGNEDLTIEDLGEMVDKEIAERKEKAKIRSEHQRRAKQFFKEQEKTDALDDLPSFAKSLFKVAATDNKEVLVGALFLETGQAKSADELSRKLREVFPALSPREALNTGSLAARARKLAHEDLRSEREIIRQKIAEKTKERGTTKANRNEAQRQLLNRIKFLENAPPSYSQRIGRVYKAALVSAVQTTTNNFLMAQATRKLETVTDFTELALNKILTKFGVELRDDAISPNTKIADVLGYMESNENIIDSIGQKAIDAVFARGIANSVLDEFPTLYESLFGSYASDNTVLHEQTGSKGKADWAMQKVENGYEKLNYLGLLQEFLVRSQEFNRVLQMQLGAKDLKLKEIIENDEIEQISDHNLKIAVDRALRVTFAKSPERNSVSDKLLNLYLKHVPGVLAPFGITFPKFLYNATSFVTDYAPIIGLMKAGYVNKKQLNSGYLKGFANLTTRQVSYQLVGGALFLVALGLVRSLGDDDKWYYLKTPFTDANGKNYYIDVRGYQPFASTIFLANKFNRLISGKPVFSDQDNAIAEVLEAMTGLSTRNLTENKFASILYYSLWGKGDDKDWERVSYLFKQQLGEIGGGFLRPLKTVKDLVAQFDEFEAKQPDTIDRPGSQGIARTLPFANRILQLEPRKDFVTGKETSQIAPGLKIFGVSVVNPDFHKEIPSKALVLMRDLTDDFKTEKDVLPESQRKSQVKGDLNRAMREAGDNKEKQKIVLEAIKRAEDSGILKEGELDFIERKKGLTELANLAKRAKLEEVERVYKIATDKEKSILQPIIDNKRNNVEKKENNAEQKKIIRQTIEDLQQKLQSITDRDQRGQIMEKRIKELQQSGQIEQEDASKIRVAVNQNKSASMLDMDESTTPEKAIEAFQNGIDSAKTQEEKDALIRRLTQKFTRSTSVENKKRYLLVLKPFVSDEVFKLLQKQSDRTDDGKKETKTEKKPVGFVGY